MSSKPAPLSDADLAAFVRSYLTDPAFPEDPSDMSRFLDVADRLEVLHRIRTLAERSRDRLAEPGDLGADHATGVTLASNETGLAILALLDGTTR